MRRFEANGPLRHLGTPAAAFVVPFAVFMVLLEISGMVKVENRLLPWWQRLPEHWMYPLQTLVCLSLLWIWRRRYPPLRLSGWPWAVLAGVLGIALWLLPPVLHHSAGWGGPSSPLRWLGFVERTDGFDPFAFSGGAEPGLWSHLVLPLRLLRLVVVVPLVEEIFWRGFLMPALSDREGPWHSLPLSRCDRRSAVLVAAAFALAHWGPDVLPALAYGLIGGWLTLRTGNLWCAVLMHAVSNAILAVFILATGWWGLW